MRHITFHEVGMENFGPYIDPMVLSFNQNSLVLITGPNGIGKTMALEAIPFTLYGSTVKGSKGDDVINNVAGKNCKTWLKFSVNEDDYILTRYHKYTKLQNTVILNKGGVDIKKGQKEVLPFIEKLVCPKKTFTNTLMFGQKVKDFFTDLLDSDKKEIFRKILDLDIYTSYYKTAKEKVDKLTKELEENRTKLGIKTGLLKDAADQIEILKDLQNKFYNRIESELKELQKSLDENKRLLKKWQDELAQLQNEDLDIEELRQQLNVKDNELSNIEGYIKSQKLELENRKNEKLRELERNARNSEITISGDYEYQRDQMLSETTKINNEMQEFSDEIKNERHKLDIEENKILSDQNYLEERIHEVKVRVLESEQSECPLCEQQVSGETITVLERKMQTNQEKLHEHESRLAEIQKSRKELSQQLGSKAEENKTKLKDVETKLDQLRKDKDKQLGDIQAKLQTTTDQVNELALNEVKKIEQKSVEDKKELEEIIRKLKAEIEDKTKKLYDKQEIENNVRDLQTTITNIQNEIKRKSEEKYDDTQLKSYNAKRASLLDEIEAIKQNEETVLAAIEVYEFWKSAFSPTGIPSMLIDEAIPFMNKQVAYYLDKLTNGRYIVSFDTLDAIKSGEFRDKISVKVVDTHTKANSRIQLSGGQTRIIDIATILTLGDLQSSIQDVTFNILLFDEIFDSLDEENIGYVCRLLSKLKKEKTIYVISHRHEDQLDADEVFAFH